MYINIFKKFLIFSAVFFFAIFFLANISLAQTVKADASLFFTTSKTTFNKGDDVSVMVKVKSPDQKINAVTGSFAVPDGFHLKDIETTGSILDFWVEEPKVSNGILSFQGVGVKKSYKGDSGLVFVLRGTVESAKKISFAFRDAVVLADDGNATNILGSMQSLNLDIKDGSNVANPTNNIIIDDSVEKSATPQADLILPPVITSAVPPINPSESFTLTGKGSPNALTKIQFQDVTEQSFGVSFIRSLVKNRVALADAEVQNDDKGVFSYISPTNLVAGVYNAVPEYVSNDKTQSVIGRGVELFVQENILSKILIIIINVLVLVIPIVALLLLIIFLPWYFIKRLGLVRKNMEFEEQKIEAEEHDLYKNKSHGKKV